jgi:hypothetical protein
MKKFAKNQKVSFQMIFLLFFWCLEASKKTNIPPAARWTQCESDFYVKLTDMNYIYQQIM